VWAEIGSWVLSTGEGLDLGDSAPEQSEAPNAGEHLPGAERACRIGPAGEPPKASGDGLESDRRAGRRRDRIPLVGLLAGRLAAELEQWASGCAKPPCMLTTTSL
jgi:hypothetical protein